MAPARVETVEQAYYSHSPGGNSKTQTGSVAAHSCVFSGRVGHFSCDFQTPRILLNLPARPQRFLGVPKLFPGPLRR